MSPELQAMYQANRVKMLELKRQFRMFFWFTVALAAMWFGSAFFIGAASTIDESVKGPFKFFTAMSTGVMQILIAIATFVLGSLTSQRKRIPSLIAIGIYGVSLVVLLLQVKTSLSPLSIGLLVLSLGVHIWAQMLCNHDDELKEEPGYPLFSVEADTPAEFEVSAVVRARAKKASEDMETVGGGSAAPAHHKPELTAPSEPIALSEIYANRVPGQAPPKLGPISLETQQVNFPPAAAERLEAFAAPEPVPQPEIAAPAPEIPQVQPLSADDILGVADEGLSGRANYQPHEELLPDPAEVRRRLAAMKKAREQGKSQQQ